MLRQSRTRPLTPSRYTDNNNHVTEATKSEERRASRSSLIRKQNHWSQDLKEVTLVARKDGVFNFRIVGGSDHGDFPVISEVMPADTRGVEYIGQAELITQVQSTETEDRDRGQRQRTEIRVQYTVQSTVQSTEYKVQSTVQSTEERGKSTVQSTEYRLQRTENVVQS